MIFNSQWVKEVNRGIKQYFETYEIGNTTYQNLRKFSKAVVRGKVVVIMPTLQNEANLKNFPLHFKDLEIEEQTKPKVSRKKEITKITAEINENETRKTLQMINEAELIFCNDKIDKSFARLPQKREPNK